MFFYSDSSVVYSLVTSLDQEYQTNYQDLTIPRSLVRRRSPGRAMGQGEWSDSGLDIPSAILRSIG